MPRLQPQSASADLCNRVLDLAGEDTAALRQAKFRLQHIFRRSPSDSVAALGLLHTHVKLGERVEADVLADELWGRRASLTLTDKLVFVPVLSWIGRGKDVLALIDDRIFASTPLALEIRRVAAVQTFLANWDPNMRRDDASIHPDWMSAAEAGGLLPHMQSRQALVNALVRPLQCGERLLFCPDGEDNLNLMRLIYVPLDYPGRRDLADRIALGLQNFYRDAGIENSTAFSLLSEVILPVTALPGQGELAQQAA